MVCLYMVANTYQATLASELQLELGKSTLLEDSTVSMVKLLMAKVFVVMPIRDTPVTFMVMVDFLLRTLLATMPT